IIPAREQPVPPPASQPANVPAQEPAKEPATPPAPPVAQTPPATNPTPVEPAKGAEPLQATQTPVPAPAPAMGEGPAGPGAQTAAPQTEPKPAQPTAEPSPAAPPAGSTPEKIVTPNSSMEIDAKPEIVELGSLKTSDMPDYPADRQPRDRSSKRSEAQITEITKNFDPERLGDSRTTDQGAPIIGPEEHNYVESGN